jgi:hypothetical protein
MAKKAVDPKETYEIRELFSCGEGHFLMPGFTHWEEGEACPHGHDESASNEDVHLYYRKLMFPVEATDGGSLWTKLSKPENANKWGQLPVAP